MALTVSFNGADNTGKTTQIGLLPHAFGIMFAGSLHDCDTKMSQVVQSGKFRDWWWDSTDEDFVCTIFGALGRRYWNSLAAEHISIIVFDRGTTMFHAVAVAMLAIKREDHDLIRARTRLREIQRQYALRVPQEQLVILLKHGKSLEESVNITVQREDGAVDERYFQYQTLLQTELQHQEDEGLYQHIVTIGEQETHGEVQKKVREIILSRTHDSRFAPMLHGLTRIYAFGGLSEAGKSSLAQGMCDLYGSKLAFRSKIVHFDDMASEKLKKSIYSLDEKEQALSLLHELESFAHRHYWLKIITIESLHRNTMTMWLKTWLGDKLQIIFVDTSDDRRLERSCDPYRVMMSKDMVKRERGAHLIRGHADLILNNDGTFEESMRRLTAFANLNVNI
ncbi:uncharacterized protein KY384_005339 [Bacidia gigantensis]|uniref:uncharacterized protein n=1 Tax=Bacidia gigantensis TaxID=2732470 RepID=UPI001D044C1A|nr:uncharacterized protein KY384_005339 [Bacidia gigantensis]KAG8529858.1 hypothetical protein KY384_005339 [Bacidia gigantensis]